MIEIRNVSKSFGPLRVVNDVTLTIPGGGVTSIIGPNGAGKSTLLAIMARLMLPDEGTVCVDGMDVARTDGNRLARHLAILRQDNHISARLTVRDLVTFGRYPVNRGRPTQEDHAEVEQALAYLDLTSLSHRFLDELSGGQRQRAFIAMTMCQGTNYILLDEPLNNLDVRHAVELMKLLRGAARDLSKTIVMVIHDVNFASCYSDLVVAMRDGQVVMQGAPVKVIAKEPLSSLFGCRFDVHDIGHERIATYYV